MYNAVYMIEKVKKNPGKTIRLREDTVQRIDQLKPRGQSYDGFISDLIDFYMKNKGKTGKT